MYICVYVYIYVDMYICIYVYIYTYICICICLYIHACLYIYISKYPRIRNAIQFNLTYNPCTHPQYTPI